MNKKELLEHYWNHRIVTHVIKSPFPNGEDERVFSITEVHYENGVPSAYGENMNVLKDHTSVKDLIWTNNRVKEALKKPVLDLENWPNEWKQTE